MCGEMCLYISLSGDTGGGERRDRKDSTNGREKNLKVLVSQKMSQKVKRGDFKFLKHVGNTKSGEAKK